MNSKTVLSDASHPGYSPIGCTPSAATAFPAVPGAGLIGWPLGGEERLNYSLIFRPAVIWKKDGLILIVESLFPLKIGSITLESTVTVAG